MKLFSRRQVLGGGSALLATTALSPIFSTHAELTPEQAVKRIFPTADERMIRLLGPDRPASPLWTFQDQLLNVVRMPHGASLHATLRNNLAEHTTIHWHGLRIENAMDGVPFLTQPPVEPGETFDYRFTPPDTGTFFYHPHCNTVEQLGRGMAGVLIVEGDETKPSDADIVCVLKDWHIGEDGAFSPFSTNEGAAKGGTFGTFRTTNGMVEPEFSVPANGDIRLRILNIDNSRVSEIGIEGAPAAVIAIDGNPVPPFPLHSWRMGPAMRLDIVVRAPNDGQTVRLVDYFAPEPVTLARLTGSAASDRVGGRIPAEFNPAPLRPSQIPEPDLATAERLTFAFSASAVAQRFADDDAAANAMPTADELCLADRTFWSINKKSWPQNGHGKLPPPLASLKRGKSYIFELINQTPHQHPIHIHGHTFKVLKSNRKKFPVHHADTVLLAPKERVEVAFVADNPGDWMFHCHIIEHQDTGMMGIIRVA